ncbi:uncharacterized protein LOC131021175 isoform X2 [Salvia miltiorrhiza]|uniref:uncharacterized protein LOC131021175 isoform X2 n=1 Tax=Salvia miltiorrhiza TaxID=226208 RepID=UPI0025AC7932|nr:uncharacterized protein LOC131021175 isoform X2 [Salvia miltiorrhiza]
MVFPYGSVPLKTYLPDGDIDLTAFGGANVEDTLADEMKSVLEEEERNIGAEFVVKDVQLIRAEVKLVKCIVQDIVVDISFNQIGGLCTLCFLEQVDRLIGRDHLFKRSIILIKAWCYYESRILGAHHGLISTYALETLVLYIFHLYHSALDGPLAVLYKFLDYFSKFDWDAYCVSLNGVVRLSSLPSFVVEIPEDSDKDLLLSNDFLNNCVDMFSVPSRVGDKTPRVFPRKHLNIVDPLKEINNLGRSVSKGNFYRIRSAFSYGARKLARILLQPQDSIADELQKFFANTMARHGGGQRPDVQDFDKLLISNRPVSVAPFPNAGFCRTDNFDEYMDEYAISTADWQSSSGKLSEDSSQGFERKLDTENREQNTISALDGNKISADACVSRTPSAEESVNGSEDSDKCEKSASLSALSGSDEGGVSIVGSRQENVLVGKAGHAVLSTELRDAFWDQKSPSMSGDSNHVDMDQSRARMSGLAESLDSTDLTGDYDCYIQHLQHGRRCYEYGLGMHPLPVAPLPSAPYPWEGLLPILHYKQNGFSHHHNGFHPSPAIYGMQPVLLPAVPFAWDDVPKHRGTGTYLPNTNMSPHGNRSPGTKGRNQAPSRSMRHHNGRNMTFHDPNMLHELSQPVDKTLGASASSSDSYPTFPPHQNGHPKVNGVSIHRESIEVELVGHPPVSENSRPQRTVSSSPRTPSGAHKTQTALSREQDRMSLRSSYRLKDEDDFPPLSS